MAGVKNHELYEGMSDEPKHHELYEGMSAKPAMACSRRQKYLKKRGMSQKPPMGCDDKMTVSCDDAGPGFLKSISRLNNRYGVRAITRPISNTVNRLFDEPTMRVNKEGDEEPDPASVVKYHAKHEKFHDDEANAAAERGDTKGAEMHKTLARAHGKAREYHRDQVGKFASFSAVAMGKRHEVPKYSQDYDRIHGRPEHIMEYVFRNSSAAQKFVDYMDAHGPTSGETQRHGAVVQLADVGDERTAAEAKRIAIHFGGKILPIDVSANSFSHKPSRRQAYAMSMGAVACADSNRVEFVANKNQARKFMADLKQWAGEVHVIESTPVGPSGGRMHIVVECDNPETLKFIRQWAKEFKAVEKPDWAQPKHVHPKAVKQFLSFGFSRRQAYALSQAVKPVSMGRGWRSKDPKVNARADQFLSEFKRYASECKAKGIDIEGFFYGRDSGRYVPKSMPDAEKQQRLKRLESMMTEAHRLLGSSSQHDRDGDDVNVDQMLEHIVESI